MQFFFSFFFLNCFIYNRLADNPVWNNSSYIYWVKSFACSFIAMEGSGNFFLSWSCILIKNWIPYWTFHMFCQASSLWFHIMAFHYNPIFAWWLVPVLSFLSQLHKIFWLCFPSFSHLTFLKSLSSIVLWITDVILTTNLSHISSATPHVE